jgi:dTDP-4-dehydrorhamnose 3,5-epimerase
MDIEYTAIAGVVRLTPRRHSDARGFFCETYSRSALAAAGIALDFVQDNLSRSIEAGTVRGLHFQTPPFAQAKLVSVPKGRVLDVAVDIRRGSPTFAGHVVVELSAEAGNQLFVPVGFAHGFCTLEPDTLLAYKVSAFFSAEHDRGILWNDPALAIAWPVSAAEARLSDKDRALPPLQDIEIPFAYEAAEAGAGR